MNSNMTMKYDDIFDYGSNTLTYDLEHILRFLTLNVGPIRKIIPVQEGVVHYVYRIEAESQTAYLKIRGNHFSGIPSVECKPRDIVYEKRAIYLLSDLAPGIFPHLIGFDEARGMLLITDVMAGHKSLKSYFDRGLVNLTILCEIGKTIGHVHQISSKLGSIRGDSEQQTYCDNLFYRLGCHHNTTLDQLIARLNQIPRQLILGDLSPKNIGISDDYHVSLCDLDAVHLGNIVFDVGFFIGHILVHTMGKGIDLIYAFLDGYQEHDPLTDQDCVLKQVALGTCLYRLNNPVVPYPLLLNKDHKRCLIRKTACLLQHPCLSWKSICDEFACCR